jgi:AraC-like DNA-binding protein
VRPSVNVQYYRPEKIPGIEIARIESSNHCFPRHFHQHTYSLGLVDIGASYCLDKRSEALTSGCTTALINPGQIHTGIPYNDQVINYRMIYIAESFLNNLVYEITGRTESFEFKGLVSDDSFLRGGLNQLSQQIILEYPLMEIESSLLTVFSYLFGANMRISCPDPVSDSVFERAKSSLGANLNQTLSLEDMANDMGLSRYQCLRGFKKKFGLTPHSYRIQMRLEKAASLIRSGTGLLDTAMMTGFTDQSHFSKVFKNYYGATPYQFALIQ